MLAAIATLPSKTPPWCEPKLPDTGTASGQLFVVALTCVVVGLGFLLLARRLPAVATLIAVLALVGAVGVPRASAVAGGDTCPAEYVSVPVFLVICDDVQATEVTYRSYISPAYTPGWTGFGDVYVRGGQRPYTYSAAGLNGYTLNAATGDITHVDAAPGITTFTLTVTDQTGRSRSAPASVNWDQTFVADFQYPVPGRTVDGPAADASNRPTWGKAPYTYAANGLTGYVVDSTTGKITWDGATAAATSGVINVSDATGAQLAIPVELQRSTVYTLKRTFLGTAGVDYLEAVNIDGWGTAPYTYSATDLPGWTIDSQKGTLTYNPPAAMFESAARVVGTVTVTDSTGATVNIPVSLDPQPRPPAVDC